MGPQHLVGHPVEGRRLESHEMNLLEGHPELVNLATETRRAAASAIQHFLRHVAWCHANDSASTARKSCVRGRGSVVLLVQLRHARVFFAIVGQLSRHNWICTGIRLHCSHNHTTMRLSEK